MPRNLVLALLASVGPTFACGASPEIAPAPGGAAAAAVAGLRVQHHTYTGSSTNQLAPLISIVNGGTASVPLSALTIRYWYTKDGPQAQNYWCDYTPRGCANVTHRFVTMATPVATADTYLELGFTAGAGTLAPGASTGDIQSRIARSDWSSYDQSNDWSFDANRSAPADRSRITLYEGGVLIWGEEPGGPTPADTQPPTAPAGLAASGVTASTVALSWSASTDDVGVAGYDVYSGSTRVISSTSTSAVVSGLAAGTAYTFTVRARDAAGNVSVPSGTLTVTTGTAADTLAPTAPSNLTSTEVTTSSVTLSWSPSTDDVGVTGYDVSSGNDRVASSTTTRATASGLSPGTTYTFTVRARDAAANTSSPSGAVTVTTPSATQFELLWQDDFNSFDSSRWQLMTHSWDGNLATFSTSNTRFQSGILSLLLTREPSDTAKPFRGVEMRSRDTLTYGKIETRARYARGSGVVSGTVLIYTPWPPDDWNELDIEYLGAFADRMQFNAMVWMGGQPVSPTQFPQKVSLGFDASADFHVYGIEWTPAIVRFTVDGVVKATWSSELARMRLPQNILLTIWASSSPDWAGPILSNSAPTQADFDWIRVYRYRP